MSDEPKGPFWHDYNPWKDQLIYVTEQEWLDCLFYQQQREHYMQQLERRPFHDLYIIPAPSGVNDLPQQHSMGLRYGRNGPDYLSPQSDNLEIQRLIERYRGG